MWEVLSRGVVTAIFLVKKSYNISLIGFCVSPYAIYSLTCSFHPSKNPWGMGGSITLQKILKLGEGHTAFYFYFVMFNNLYFKCENHLSCLGLVLLKTRVEKMKQNDVFTFSSKTFKERIGHGAMKDPFGHTSFLLLPGVSHPFHNLNSHSWRKSYNLALHI